MKNVAFRVVVLRPFANGKEMKKRIITHAYTTIVLVAVAVAVAVKLC